MKKPQQKFLIPLMLSILTILLTAYSSNPPEDYTGAPPLNRTCGTCHRGGNNFDGDIQLTGLPDEILPGSTHKITITVSNPNGQAVRAGFQMVAIDEMNNGVGTYGFATGGAATQQSDGRTYVEQRGAQPFGSNNEASWSIDFTAPEVNLSDSIKFYAVGNIANGGGTSGDLIVTTVKALKIMDASPALTGAINVDQNISCNAGTDGIITVNIQSGTAPYTYNWSADVGNTATVNNLSAGNYTVTVTDASDQRLVLSANLDEPEAININIQEKSDVDCANPTGFVRIIATNGVGSYEYLWSNGSTEAIATDLAVGNYTITVTDSNGCQNELSVEIQDLSVFPVADAGDNYLLDCNNPTTMLSVANSSSGSNISYQWEAFAGGNIVTGANTATPTVNSIGRYVLTVINNSNGCQSQDEVIVEADFATPNAVIDAPDELACNATATLDGTASTGNGNLSYIWETQNGGNILGSNTNRVITVDAAGTYLLTVTNQDNGCSDVASVSLTNANAPTANASVSNIITCDNNTATLTAEGSTTGLSVTYQWSTADGNIIGSTDVFSITVDLAGTYTLTVLDNESNCTSSTTIDVNQDIELPTARAGEAAVLPCNEDFIRLDGRNSSQGTNFTYEWTATDGGNIIGGSSSLQPSINAAGTYSLLVTNTQNGCTATDEVTVTEAPLPTAVAGADQELGCDSETATVSGVGSSSGAQLIYSWSTTNGNILSGETELQAVVDQSGTYTFSVLDTETGCLTSDEVQITFATGFELELDTRIDILCQGDATGSLSVRPLQGVPPFIYNWSNGASTAQNDNLNAGTYTVTVTDANACSNVFTTTLNEPSAILVDISATAESEAGANDGQAQAIVTGGVSPFSFQWSNGENSARIVDLAPDTYSVTITDANGCTTIASTTVNAADCSLSTISLTANPVSCFGGGDGSASIIVNGGLPPYDYNWSNGTDTQENINLIAGNYGLTVTDQGGCTIETNINITQPEDLVITTSESTNPKCNSDGDGTATVAVTGGTGNYRFQWSSGSQDSVATNLFAGTYTVTVFDDNNCTITTNITITEPTALSADITTTDETTVNGMDGTVSVTPTGGTSPYRYEWSTGATTSTLDNLAAGTYGLTIFDGQNCSLSTTVNINTVNCSDFVVNLQGIAPTCIDRMDGQVVVAGDAPDGLMLDIADELLDQLAAGDYNVTATDERGCSSTQLVTVPTADTLTITIVEITPATNNDATGSIVIEVEGMGENISYGWVNSMGTVVSNEQNPANLVPDTYSLQVVYNADCVQILTNIIVDNVTNTETIASSTQFDIFPNPTADLLQVEIHHAQPAIINWVLLDYLGKTSRKNTEAIKQKRFTIDTASLPTGVYWLNIQIAEQWIVQKVVKL